MLSSGSDPWPGLLPRAAGFSMSITVTPTQDGYAVERRTEAGVCAIHVPEAEIGQLLEDLLSCAVASQIEGAPFDPQVMRVADAMYRLEGEL